MQHQNIKVALPTFTSQLIHQLNTFFDRIWFANDQLCEYYILIHFSLNLAHNWLRGVALKSRHATWPFRQGITSKSTALTKLLFLLYISILCSYGSANSRRYSKIKTKAFYLFRSSRFVFFLSKSFNFYPRGKEEKGFFLLLKPTNAGYSEYSYIFRINFFWGFWICNQNSKKPNIHWDSEENILRSLTILWVTFSYIL